MKDMKYDLTQGSILSKLIFVALPIMGMQFMQMAYNLTNMFWLGRLSSEAVAASGTAGMYLWLSMAFMMFGRMGSEIGVSQNLGKGNLKDVTNFGQTSFILATTLGVFFAAFLIIFKVQLIGFFNIKDAQVVLDSENYLVVVALGIPAMFIASVVAGIFNGSGNSRIPFYINAVGLVLNMIIDPLLIFTFDMGIMGAAVGTVVSQMVVLIISIIAVRWYKHRPIEKFRIFIMPHLASLKQIIKWGLPVATESLMFTLLTMLISRLVANWGADGIAVQRVGSQVESLSWLIAGGFASALTAFAGQNFGAGLLDRARQGFKISFKIMFVWGLLITAILFFGSRVIIGAFLPDENLINMGSDYLKILCTCQLFCCIEATTAGCFRGMGKTLPPSIVSIVFNALRVPLAYVLSSTELGINGVWWGVTIGAILRGVVIYIWFIIDSRKNTKPLINGGNNSGAI